MHNSRSSRSGVFPNAIPVRWRHGSDWSRYVFALLATALGSAHAPLLWEEFEQASRHPEPYLPFMVGIAAYAVLWLLFLRRRRQFWRIWEHETVHAVVATLLHRPVVAVEATRGRGGRALSRARSGRRSALVTLAPYIVPSFALLIPIFRVLVRAHLAVQAANAALGYAVTYHLWSVFREARPGQPDIKRVGRGVAYGVIVGFNVCLLTYLTALAGRGPEVLLEIATSAWEHVRLAITTGWSVAYHFLDTLVDHLKLLQYRRVS